MPTTRNRNEIQTLIRRIGMSMKAFQDSHLVPYGITNQQGRIVGFLRERERAGSSICQLDVEAELGVTGSSVTSLLQGLERNGFIVRRARASDARAKELFITEKGRALVDEFDKVFNEAEKRLIHGFSSEEREIFAALLRRALMNIK